MNIEMIMQKEGWIRKERMNAGKQYIEFHKNGIGIDIDDIWEEPNNE